MSSLVTADYEDLFKRWAQMIRAERRVAYLQDRFKSVKPKIFIIRDDSAQLSDWVLTNLNSWEDLGEDYLLYVELSDAGPGTRTVDVYDSVGKGNRIATGTKVGDGSVTLAEDNDSGVSGSVTNAYTGDDADIILLADTAYKEALDDLPAETTDDDQSLLRDDSDRNAKNTCDSVQTALAGERSKLLGDQDFFVITVVKDLIESGESFAAAVVELKQTDDSITLDEEGVIKDLIDIMIEDSEILYGSTPTMGAATITSTYGSTTITKAVQDWVRLSQYKMICNKTIDAAGPETFKIQNDKYGDALNFLTMGAQFRSGSLGLELLFARELIHVAGTTASSFASMTLSDENSNNVDMGTAGGRLWGNIATTGADHDVSLYRASGLADADLVATGTLTGAGPGVVTFASENGSGISFAGTLTYVDDGTFSINLKAFAVDDYIKFSVTTESSGLLLKYLGHRYRMEFPGEKLGAATLDTDGDYGKIPEDVLLVTTEIIY